VVTILGGYTDVSRRDGTKAQKRPGKPGGARARNRREKTQRIASAALDRFIVHGIERVTIGEIASAADIAKGGFYRYFDDRAALVAFVMQPLRETLDSGADTCRNALDTAASSAEVSDAYTGLATTLATLLLEHPRELLLYLQESRAPGDGDRRAVRALSEHVAAVAVDLTRIAQTLGLVKETPHAVSALAVVGAAERLIYAGLTAEVELDPITAGTALVDLVLEGVRIRAD
jgi:AcrR family transcriptional regulator